MEAVASINPSIALNNKKSLYSPNIQKVCFPASSISRRCITRAADDAGKKPIRLTIQAESPGKSDPEKFVIEVPEPGKNNNGVRESLAHVASESAVESPDQVHEQAKHEAGGLASGTGEKVEKVAEDLEEQAERASEKEAEHLGSETPAVTAELGEELQKAVEGAAKTSFESGQKARVGLESARGEVEKRVSVLVEAAEEAGLRGSQVVEAAKRSFEDLKGRFGGVQESASKAAGDVQRNIEELQRKLEQQTGSGAEKLRAEMEKGLKVDDPEKHRAVDPENVNKDGAKKLVEQHKQSEKDDEDRRNSVVSETIRDLIDPVLERSGLQRSGLQRELQEEPEIGDGNEHLKNMNDLILHDSYAPIDEDGR